MADRLGSRLCLLACLALCAVSVSGQVNPCQDLDTTACVLLHKQKPDLCADPSFSTIACKRFCGLCPLMCYVCPSPVLDPDDCNTTVACAPQQECMTKHLRAADGHDEYIMTCEPKTVCEGLNFGFIGKRGIQSRDVSLECCDTDFCNMPARTTLPPPTTTVTSGFSNCMKDIVFVLDDSGSVGTTNFKHSRDFVRNVLTGLDIGPNSNQVALMAFSSHPQISWYLNTHMDKTSVFGALNNVKFASGTTNTDEALQAVKNNILIPQRGDRAGVRNVVIVLSDGQSAHKSQTIQAASELHTVSDDVISIVVGSSVDSTELVAIATDSHHVIDVRGFQNLGSIIPKLLSIICA